MIGMKQRANASEFMAGVPMGTTRRFYRNDEESSPKRYDRWRAGKSKGDPSSIAHFDAHDKGMMQIFPRHRAKHRGNDRDYQAM
jgi:hypothetical protein